MKWIIIAAIFLPLAGHSQVYKYRCFEYKTFYDDASREKNKWDSSNVLIVLDSDRQKLKTFGAKEQDIDLIGLDTAFKSDDGNHLLYRGVNEKGDKCNIEIITYSHSFDDARGIIMSFKDYSVAVRLKKND
jgi:hypothetical protein